MNGGGLVVRLEGLAENFRNTFRARLQMTNRFDTCASGTRILARGHVYERFDGLI